MRKSKRAVTKVELFQATTESEGRKPVGQHEASDKKELPQEEAPMDLKCFTAKDTVQCILCRTERNEEMLLGEILRCYDPNDIKKHGLSKDGDLSALQATSVHYGCLLSACNLWQKGDESLQLKGFLVSDLKAESRRCSREVCVYCGLKGAVVGCCVKRCKRMFHFPCGLENGCRTEFFGCYNSWCDKHVEQQQIPSLDPCELCPICADELGSTRLFFTECCSHTLHVDCLRPYVYNAGTYYLKCPFCQNVKLFKELVAKYAGVHIPTREPTYENHDRMVVELVCCYENCPDPDLCIDNEDWRLIKCTICGSRAMHVMCVAKAFVHCRFICPDCGDNDSLEAFYRLKVCVGSGSAVGRMFPWQFFSLKQLVHSVRITQHSHQEQSDSTESPNSKRSKLELEATTRNKLRHCKPDSMSPKATKKTRKSQQFLSEIDDAKRGTKQLLGEVDLSSDEDEEPDEPYIPVPTDPLDVSFDLSDNGELVQTSVKSPAASETAESNSRKRKKRENERRTKDTETETVVAMRESVKNKSSSSSRDLKLAVSQVDTLKDIEPVVEKKTAVCNIEMSVNPSKENEQPKKGRKANRGQQSATVQSKKPAIEVVDLRDDEDDLIILDDEVELKKERRKSGRHGKLNCEKDGDESENETLRGIKQSLVKKSLPVLPLENATVFKRPLRDPNCMRQVVVSSSSSASRKENLEECRGAEHFHFKKSAPESSAANRRSSQHSPKSKPSRSPVKFSVLSSPLTLRVNNAENSSRLNVHQMHGRLRSSPQFVPIREISSPRAAPQHHTY